MKKLFKPVRRDLQPLTEREKILIVHLQKRLDKIYTLLGSMFVMIAVVSLFEALLLQDFGGIMIFAVAALVASYMSTIYVQENKKIERRIKGEE